MSKHKYSAVATVVDGIRFHSKAEARRYGELKLLQKAREITELKLQPVFVLHAPDPYKESQPVVGRYVGDFSYMKVLNRGRDGLVNTLIVEDVKGYDTDLSKWKRRHVEAEYGIPVQIVSRRSAA